MIRVSVLYPNEETKRFDMDYYCNQHMPMVKEKLGSALIGASVEQGISSAEPGSPATYIAIGQLQFVSMEDFQACWEPNVESFMEDVQNYTDIEPMVQISEIIM
jgi:uncharacterized protein (TIGR02118 family)